MKHRWEKHTYCIIVCVLVICCTCYGQQTANNLQDNIDELKKGQEAIREELQIIRSLLLKMQTSAKPSAKVDVHGVEFEPGINPYLGSNNAKVVMIEFSDYQCSFCSRFVRETFSKIKSTYIDSGKLRFLVMDLPLSMHKLAPKAAEASHCAIDQGKFWEMHNKLMSNQESLDKLSSIAATLNMDTAQFEDCLEKDKYAKEVDKESKLAGKLGIMGVPGFVLAEYNSENPSKVRGICFIAGSQPFSTFQKEIDQALAIVAQHKDAPKGESSSEPRSK